MLGLSTGYWPVCPLPDIGTNVSKVAAEMALSVLAYNMTWVKNIVGTKPLMAAIVT
jgi:hypothetical protein